MEILKLTQKILEVAKAKKTVSGLLSVQSVSL